MRLRPSGQVGGRRFRHCCQGNERMTTETLNGCEHPAWQHALGRNARLRRPAKPHCCLGSGAATSSAGVFGRRALGPRPGDQEQKLGAALRLIDDLQGQECSLKKKVATLSEAAAQARQFRISRRADRPSESPLLLDRFNQAMAQAARQHKLVALLFLDLDGFKTINDA